VNIVGGKEMDLFTVIIRDKGQKHLCILALATFSFNFMTTNWFASFIRLLSLVIWVAKTSIVLASMAVLKSA
jgi:hypothetical protein